MILTGALLERLPNARYAAQLPFAELALRAPLPRTATLRRQRGLAEGTLQLALRAPRSALSSAAGPLRFDEELQTSFDWLLGAADALAACAVVLPTPADLTPGARARDLLAALAERLPRNAGRHWVWEPAGAWEQQDAERLARGLGLVLAFDPLLTAKPPGSVAYARLRALGGRRSFSQSLLEEVLAKLQLEPADTTYVVFDAPRAVKHAVDLAALCSAEEA